MRAKTMLAVAVSLALCVSAFAEDTVLLKGVPEAGTYVVEVETDMDMTMTMAAMPGQEIPSRTQMMMVMEMVVGEPDPEDLVTYTTTYKRISMSSETMGMSMAFDSAEPEAATHPAGEVFQRLIGQPIQVTVDAEGEMKEVTGLDEMVDQMVQDQPHLAPMAEEMKENLGQEMLSQLGIHAQLLPNRPVAKGETWEAATKQPVAMLGEMDVKFEVTLKDIQDGVAIVEYKGEMKAADAEDAPMPDAELKRFEAKTTGLFRQDTETGLTSESAMDQDFEIVLSVEGRELNMKGESKTKVSTTPGEYEALVEEAALQ